jgi:hypothetical protein
VSGPKTVVIGADPFVILLSAAAIRAAQAIQEGHANAARLHEANAIEGQARRGQLGAARQAETQRLDEFIRSTEARLKALISMASSSEAAKEIQARRPVPPESADTIQKQAYLLGLKRFADDLEMIQKTEAAAEDEALAEQAPDITLPKKVQKLTLARRLLERIAHLGAPPVSLAKLAEELDRTLPGERADLLASELRRQVQQLVDATQKRMIDEATAIIVRQSLQDLGYQVEDIPETLFVEGGVAHFRRSDWGDYMVRMRVSGEEGAANFNVVRATNAGSAAEPSVLDHLAEDRWCAEFPTLLKTLEARGAALTVTRHLAPGELPVQMVERDQLPHFAASEEETVHSKPLAREIK